MFCCRLFTFRDIRDISFLAFPCAVKGSTAKIHLVGEDLAKAVKGCTAKIHLVGEDLANAVKGCTAKIHLVGEDLAKAVKGTGLKGKLLFFSFCLEALKLHFCLSNILLASEHVQLKSKHFAVLSIKKKTGPDKNAAIHGGGGGGFLLTCENLGRMFDNSFPAFACFLFF